MYLCVSGPQQGEQSLGAFQCPLAPWPSVSDCPLWVASRVKAVGRAMEIIGAATLPKSMVATCGYGPYVARSSNFSREAKDIDFRGYPDL